MNNWRCNNCNVVLVGLPGMGVKVANGKLKFEDDDMAEIGGEVTRHTRSDDEQ